MQQALEADSLADVSPETPPGTLIHLRDAGTFGYWQMDGVPALSPLPSVGTVDQIPDDAAPGALFLVGESIYAIPEGDYVPTLGHVRIGEEPVYDAVGPLNGYVFVRHSADFIASDGRPITATTQRIEVSEGRFLDPVTQEPWRLDRSSDPAAFVLLNEEFLQSDGTVIRRTKTVTVPTTLTDGDWVGYLSLQKLRDSLPAAQLEPWAQQLQDQIDAAEAVATRIEQALANTALIPTVKNGRLVYVYREAS